MLAIVGCGPGDSVTVDGGGPPVDVQLTVAPLVTVVLGETASFDVDVSIIDASAHDLTITTSPLPEGITCSTAAVTTFGTTHVTLTLAADSSAAIAELPIDVIATSNEKILASTSVQLEVSSVAGSLDPTFGAAGVLTLPAGANNPSAIGIAPDGTIVVTGMGPSKIFIERFAPNASPDAPWQFGSNVTSSTTAAIAADGRVAIDMQDSGNNETVTEIDATNTVIVTRQIPSATALAWDGSDLFVATSYDLRRFGPSGDATLPSSNMIITSLETTAPGIVLAAGSNASANAVIDTFTANGTTIDQAPYIEVSTGNVSTTNTVTTAKGTLVGLAGAAGASAVRLDAQGAVLATYPLDERFANTTEVLALPNGEPLLIGTAQLAPQDKVSAPAGFVVAFDAAFGALGHAYIPNTTTLVAGAIDATGRYLYVTGTMSTQSGFRGWIARIRLTSTP